MLRKIVNTETSRAVCNLLAHTPDAFSIKDTLECGHITYRKGSAGFAVRRQCLHCDHLKGGGISICGDIRETWNDETQMPKRERVHDEQALDGEGTRP